MWSDAELQGAHTVGELHRVRTHEDRTGYTQDPGKHTRHDTMKATITIITIQGQFTIHRHRAMYSTRAHAKHAGKYRSHRHYNMNSLMKCIVRAYDTT